MNNAGGFKSWKRTSRLLTKSKVSTNSFSRCSIVSPRNTVQYDETLIKLANAETEIEGLKLQLDDALHAEDLLVKLTERNLELGEVRNITFSNIAKCLTTTSGVEN